MTWGTHTGLWNSLLEGTNRTLYTRTQEKGAVSPQETDPDYPVSVQESLAETWVDCGLSQCQGHWPHLGATRETPLVAQLVKKPPAMHETWIQSLIGKIPWRRQSLPTPVFWPGEFHGLYSPWGCKESDTAEWLSLSYLMSNQLKWFRVLYSGRKFIRGTF